MPQLDRRQLLIIGAGALVMILLYRWYAGRSGGGAPAQQMPDDTAGAIGSQLAGQEQADASGLAGQEQGDVQALQQTEVGDVADLSGGLNALASTEASDVNGLNSAIGGLSDQLGGLSDQVAAAGPSGAAIKRLTHRINQIASGQKKTNRQVSTLAKQAKHGRKQTGRKKAAAKHAAGGHATHPHGHQSPSKHAGSGAVAPSSHHAKPHVTAHPKTKTVATRPARGKAVQQHPPRGRRR